MVEKKKNEISMVVVACSDTESVSISVVIKNGFAELRYLNAGKSIMLEETIVIPAILVPPHNTRPLRSWFLPNFLIITHTIRNAVQPIRKNPLIFEINSTLVRSNDMVIKIKMDVKIVLVHIMNLLSFLRNGSAKNKSPIANIKN